MQALQQAQTRSRAEKSLAEFIRQAWPVVEPSQPYIHGRHIDLYCELLEAVSRQEIESLLVNVPPAHMKSLTCCVFFFAWVWARDPASRWLFSTYAEALSVRDSLKSRRLIESDWYRRNWGDVVKIASDQNSKQRFENTKTGVRLATSVEGMTTGEGGNYIVIDDPHSATGAQSDAERQRTLDWWTGTMSTRHRPPGTGGRIVIMQRLHHMDLSGLLLEQGGWEHVCLPAEFEATHPHVCARDWRKREHELLWPEMFNARRIDRLKHELSSPYAIAGQLQQRPTPAGGGVIRSEWWEPYLLDDYPRPELTVLSCDTAYTKKEAGDWSACTVWGIYRDNVDVMGRYIGAPLDEGERLQLRQGRRLVYDDDDDIERDGRIRILMLYAWRARLEFNGLVDKIQDTAKRYKANTVLVEGKASGISVLQELRRRMSYAGTSIHQVNPRGDKHSRGYAVQGLFEQGLISTSATLNGERVVFAPWAQTVIDECAAFPNGQYDDLFDTVTQALQWVRNSGIELLPSDTTPASPREGLPALY